MWTGRQTLSSIESAIAKLHGEEGQLDGALRSAVGDAERLRKERSDALRELARIKLDEMTAGKLVEQSRCRRTPRRADPRRLSHAHRRRHGAARGADEGGGGRGSRTPYRGRSGGSCARGGRQPARAGRGKRAGDGGVARGQDGAGRGRGRRRRGREEGRCLRSRAGAKQKPYDDDALFAYLWRRRFGTREYAGTGIAKTIDRMVAEFVGFTDARPNYAALIEIPLRLREHATAKRAALEQPQGVLSAIERRAMLAAGVEAKEKALAEARHRLAVLDDTVEKKHGLLREVDQSRAALVAGDTNPAYNEALSTIAAADSKDDLRTLYMEARRTPTTADEAVVRRLETIDATIGKTDGEIARLRSAMVELSASPRRGRAGSRQVPQDGLRPPANHLRERGCHQRYAGQHPGRCGAQRRAVGAAAPGLQVETDAGQSGFRRGKLPVSVPPARWLVGQRQLAGRQLARAVEPRQLVARPRLALGRRRFHDRRLVLILRGSGPELHRPAKLPPVIPASMVRAHSARSSRAGTSNDAM